jgi:hypothetical protein
MSIECTYPTSPLLPEEESLTVSTILPAKIGLVLFTIIGLLTRV